MEASAKEYLRKSLQGECRDGLHADRHDRTVATDAAGVNSELGPRPHDVLLTLKNALLAVSRTFSKFGFDG